MARSGIGTGHGEWDRGGEHGDWDRGGAWGGAGEGWDRVAFTPNDRTHRLLST